MDEYTLVYEIYPEQGLKKEKKGLDFPAYSWEYKERAVQNLVSKIREEKSFVVLIAIQKWFDGYPHGTGSQELNISKDTIRTINLLLKLFAEMQLKSEVSMQQPVPKEGVLDKFY